MKHILNRRNKITTKRVKEKRMNTSGNSVQNEGLYYRLIFESAQHGILIIHAKTGKIEDVNPCLLTLLGYSRRELLSKKAWELYGDTESARKNFQIVLEKGEYLWNDLPLLTRNGNSLAVEVVCSVYQLGRKKLIQCNIREMTGLKRTEKSLKNLSHAINASGDVVFMTDKDGIITSINPRFTELYGYTAEEVVNKAVPRFP